MSKSKKNKKSKNIAVAIFILIIAIAALGGFIVYTNIYKPNVKLSDKSEAFIYIPTGSNFSDVVEILNESRILVNPSSFVLVAEKMEYPKFVKAGKYQIKDNMNNKDLVRLLRSGNQTPVNLSFNRMRSVSQLCGIIAPQIEADSTSLCRLLNNQSFLDSIGYTRTTILSLFIPNTYEFYWNTNAQEFVNRMIAEHKKFWNNERMNKASRIKFTPAQVSVLASIVELETAKNDEKPIIAGVYMNRIQKNWKLEADPTLIYAAGDYSIKRVLNKHKTIESPYNTYLYNGLPPGPICIPSITSIDAVLNYKEHNYMFFCAKDDFSGYHSFARSYNDHLVNARKFQRELNRRKIKS